LVCIFSTNAKTQPTSPKIMELKVLCDCGQKYAFDVEPIANQMPFIVNCPSCGKDGTSTANSILAETSTASVVSVKAAGPIRLSVSVPVAQTTLPVQPPHAPPPVRVPELKAPRQWEKADMTQTHSLALGFVGALVGAILGVCIMVGWRMVIGFVMPAVGLLIGVLAGFGARLLYKGTDVSLGAIAAVITLFATGATFLVLFGLGAIMCIMVLVITVAVAYKIAG
jgi:hypothetical protein